MDALRLLEEFVRLPGPPGQEEAVRKAVSDQVSELGFKSRVDAKGNLLVGPADAPIVVTAHLDEIAMICRGFEGDELLVGALGGLMPWKLGEGPVTIMAPGKSLDGVLSFGSIHTEDERSPRANPKGIEWNSARVKTGLTAQELAAHGVRPGTRIAVHPCRRNLFPMGKLVASHFLDDRADLVSWLLALESLGDQDVLFAATVAEEVGGEGALYLLNSVRPEICIALELGPNVPDAPVVVNSRPTLWVSDSYSTMAAADIDLVASCGDVQFQALSRGGSDASCAASHGHTARPFTLGLPMENSHGFEIIHRDSMQALADLTVNLITKLRK